MKLYLFAALVVASPTQAQPQPKPQPPAETGPDIVPFDCANHREWVAGLKKVFNESEVLAGATIDGYAVSLLMSPRAETWTLVMRDPEGANCAWIMGEHLVVPTQKAGKPL